jgi:hypothetical protein
MSAPKASAMAAMAAPPDKVSAAGNGIGIDQGSPAVDQHARHGALAAADAPRQADGPDG